MSTRPTRRRATYLLALAVAAAQPALAALDSCTLSTAGMAFGAYDPLASSQLNGTGKISVTCKVTLVALFVRYDVKLSTGSSGVYGTRTLKNGAVTLNYNLYRNSGRTQIWGDGTSTTVFYDSGTILIAVGTTTSDIDIWGKIDPARTRTPGRTPTPSS